MPESGESIAQVEVGYPPQSAIETLRSNPRFGEAIQLTARGWIEHYRGNRVLNALVNDAGRAQMGFLVLNLHWSRRPGDPASGLTASRMIQACVEQKLCSAGRAEATLHLMRLFGYLEASSNPWDRRLKLLVPTEKLIETHMVRWRAMFQGMSLVMDEGALGLSLLHDPDFAPALIRNIYRRYDAGLSLNSAVPSLSLFSNRNAGLMILASLLTEAGCGPARLSISGLSSRFGVSRAHVRKILADATAEGLVEKRDDELVALMAAGLQLCEVFLATGYLALGGCARAASLELEQVRAVA